MRKSLTRGVLILSGILFFSLYTIAQKKLLILGSSTSTCFFGPSSFDSCYVSRLQRHFAENGIQVTIDNRAVAGDNCYHGMPLGLQVPAGRNGPRSYNNITEGLQGNPDVVIVNYPSNGYDEYSVDEVLNCLRTIKQAANNAGKECYVTTTQPRQDPESFRTAATRSKMQQIKDRVMGEFGAYAINFWDGIVNTADLTILNEYNADNVHLNNAGHRILFNRVAEKNIFRAATPPSNPNPPSTPTGTQGLNYRYYEGQWTTLPDFNAIGAVKTGASSNLDLSVKNRNENYGILWEGFINLPSSGNYTFELVSDDGSKLYFNTAYSASANAWINNDGLHGEQTATASANLNAGAYPIVLTYFQGSGGHSVSLYWTGPGISRQQVPDNYFTRVPGGTTPQPPTPPAPSTGNGSLNYKYYEGEWVSLPDFNALQPIKTGSSANTDLSVRNRSELFGILWEGSITLPVSGVYTFEVVSDDGSKMYFNTAYSAGANALVNNDGLHEEQSSAASVNMNAGSYPVAFAYFQRGGGQSMKVYWTGPGFSRQLIPSEAFSGGTGGGGNSGGSLRYRYYEGQWVSVPDFNAMNPVKSGSANNIDLGPRNSSEHFGFIWEGYIRIPQAGNYTFELGSDDGSNLYFNTPYSAGATPLVRNDGLHEEQYVSNNVYVNAPGNYPIAITYFQRGGGSTVKALWSGPGFSRQQIPDAAFSNSGTQGQSENPSTLAAAERINNKQTATLVYPNPFRESIKIEIVSKRAGESAQASVFDLSGKLIYNKDFKNLQAGMNTLVLDLKQSGRMPKGMYIVKLQANGESIKTFKIMKSID